MQVLQIPQDSHITLPPISSFDNLVKVTNHRTNTSDSSVKTLNICPSFRLNFPSQYQVSNTTLKSDISVPIRKTYTSQESDKFNTPINHILPLIQSTSFFQSNISTTSAPSTIINDIEVPKTLKVSKTRKKKQCPICYQYFANLSTHKSTHLSPESRPHKCSVCERGFARSNDLLRHKKRHWKDNININCSITENKFTSLDQLKNLHFIKGTYKCPFNSNLISLDMNLYPLKKQKLSFDTSNCHSTGLFSRCDTFKNHLKALHFQYPPGTKKKDRINSDGKCKHCGERFQNVDIWLNTHAGKTCGYEYH